MNTNPKTAMRQFFAVTALGLRSLHTRIANSLVVIFALAVVMVGLLPLLAASDGLISSYTRAANPSRALVLSVGAATDGSSTIPQNSLKSIEKSPGIARTRDGLAMADAEFFRPVKLLNLTTEEDGLTGLIGMGPIGFAMTPEIRLLSGRLPHAGNAEIIAGDLAERKFAGLALNTQMRLLGASWRVVGIFHTGSILDGDLIADATAMKLMQNQPDYNFVMVKLDSPAQFENFRHAVTVDKRLIALKQPDYYLMLIRRIPVTPLVVAYTLGLLLGMGALSGTVHTMYAAVSARAREIAILRAIGFDGAAVAASVVFEAMLLASLGALLGTLIVWLWVDGHPWNGGIQGGVFRFLVTPHVALVGQGWALVTALIGALPPALKTGRATVIDALRDR